MNELRALVEAFDATIAGGGRCALATIVSVEGSSYRRPGARMLIAESGTTIGTISAGCLENDVIEHAKRIIQTGEAKVVEYDNGSTTDAMAWGLGLGCNGIVRVLIEPLGADSLYIEALRNSYTTMPGDPHLSVATVYQCTPASPDDAAIATGARLFITEQGDVSAEQLNGSAAAMLDSVRGKVSATTASGDFSLEVGGSVAKVFVEKLLPPVPLVIFGAGHDALPIVELARGLGWQIEIVDPQARDASRTRFAIADRVAVARPEEIAAHVTITPRTMALVMSHNYAHDMALLKFLLASPARYIGVMGPRKRTERMLAELTITDSELHRDENDFARLHSPVGLDIGANGPAEIALSIVAEMLAVMEGKRGGMLHERRGPIHGQKSTDRDESTAVSGSVRDGALSNKQADRVGAIILAAGSSSRMGRPKQTLRFNDKSLLRRSAVAALEAGCYPVIVVTGANAGISRQELNGLDVRVAWNAEWETGMGSSIAAGIKGLLEPDPHVTATVIMLCDQPYATSDVISRLVSAHRLTRNTVVASKYGGGYGVPALFQSALFGELAQLEGATGAQDVITRHESAARFIDFPEGEIDVDTPYDYTRLLAGAPSAWRQPIFENRDIRTIAASLAVK